MTTVAKLSVAIVAALLGSAVHADTLYLKDGTTREGKIVGQSSTEIRLHVNEDGMEATISIAPGDVSRIVTGPVKASPSPHPPAATIPSSPPPPPASAATGHPTTQPLAAGAPSTPPPATFPSTYSALPPTRGFFTEMGLSLIGDGPDDPRRLPPDLQALWKNALQADAAGKRAAELDTLRQLDQAFSASPNGAARLDGLSRHERQEPFGVWMAGVHWDVLADNYRGGFFDLKDTRAAERIPLIGLLKEKTGPALDPLKSYFPPVDEKTGKVAPFRPAQLQGITAQNALDVQDKAQYAHAILLAQIKLEPDMPAADKQLLFTQLADVNHILSRANDLAPLARAAQEKADREKKLAEEKAKRGG